MFTSLTGRFTASQTPIPMGTAYKAGEAPSGVFPSRELEDPLASQRHLAVLLDPTARPCVVRPLGAT